MPLIDTAPQTGDYSNLGHLISDRKLLESDMNTDLQPDEPKNVGLAWKFSNFTNYDQARWKIKNLI